MVFGEPVTFLWTKDVSAHCPSQATTVSFLIDEHVAAEFLIPAATCSAATCLPAGNEGRQEGKERDLDEHVFGVDSAPFLWFAMGNNRLEWTGRTKRGPWV